MSAATMFRIGLIVGLLLGRFFLATVAPLTFAGAMAAGLLMTWHWEKEGK